MYTNIYKYTNLINFLPQCIKNTFITYSTLLLCEVKSIYYIITNIVIRYKTSMPYVDSYNNVC